jgi:uncharacterized membrane protein
MDRPAPAATPAGLSGLVAVAVVFAAYFTGLHALIARGAAPAFALALVLAPWLIAAAVMVVSALRDATRSRRLVIGIVAASTVLLAATMAWRFGAPLASSAAHVLYAENVAFFGWLFSLFALSLAPGREPLVTRVARRARRGDMPPQVVRYTRGATIAWAAFFLAVIAVSTALFFAASRGAWSLFVNLLIFPCVAAMFAGEYAVRLALLRDVHHESLWAGVRAFREHGNRDGDGR